MTDLRMTELCAKAMGYTGCRELARGTFTGRLHRYEVQTPTTGWALYDPLIDDAQTMALIKRFGPRMFKSMDLKGCWQIDLHGIVIVNEDLNRAVVESVVGNWLHTNRLSPIK